MFLRHKSKTSQRDKALEGMEMIDMSTIRQKEKSRVEFDNYLISLIASYLALRDTIKFSEVSHWYHDVLTPPPHTFIINSNYAVTGTFAELKKFFTSNSQKIDSAKKMALQEKTKAMGCLVMFVITLIVPGVGQFVSQPCWEAFDDYINNSEAAKAEVARLRDNLSQDQNQASVVITKLR